MFIMNAKVGLISGMFIFLTEDTMLETLKKQCNMLMEYYDYKNWDVFDTMLDCVKIYKFEQEGIICKEYDIRDILIEYLKIEY